MRVVLATRRSPLARAQTELVRSALAAAGAEVEILSLVTSGDRWSAEGGPTPDQGVFVKELEEALLDGRADLAVHSAKDLPADLPDGLSILATPPRADPRDVLIRPAGGLDGLREGARVGTGSPRRAAQLLAERPDLEVVPIRGNVDTRLRKLDEGVTDAIVLAAAGLERLGLTPEGVEPLPVDRFVPAPGQGALAIEGRSARQDLIDLLASLTDRDVATCLQAERGVLRALGGGCREPIGAHATLDEDHLSLHLFRADDEVGTNARHVRVDGAASDPIGSAAGAAKLLVDV